MILGFNDFEVLTANNGAMALEILSYQKKLPDLIISDIMMPEMDGHEFFQTVSKNPLWAMIPFIFLTAKATPEDIRLGKLLGVDDYLTKPFKEEDLLATINGKLIRRDKIKQINKKVSKLIGKVNINPEKKIEKFSKTNVCLIFAFWDEEDGPVIKKYYPKNWSITLSIEDLGTQLFQATVAIYGYENYDQSQEILLEIKNISSVGLVYFDAIPDMTVRGGFRQFMISVIAPRITYFESLRINSELKKFAQAVKEDVDWKIKTYWEKISEILISEQKNH